MWLRFLVCLLAAAVTEMSIVCHGFSPTTRRHVAWHPHSSFPLEAVQRKSSETLTAEAAALLEEEETPAGIAGSEFFGGNKQKEELYDPIAEAQATITFVASTEKGGEEEEEILAYYNRLDDVAAFEDDNNNNNSVGKQLAESLQQQVNAILYGEEETSKNNNAYTYATNVVWESPLGKTTTTTSGGGISSPLDQLQQALDFYRRIDLAIISCRPTNNNDNNTSFTLRWEISVLWPIFWEARVVLTGTSLVQLDTNTNQIVRQVDRLDSPDVLGSIVSQVLPRFWDTYHIGMSPSAECLPKIPVKQQQPPSSSSFPASFFFFRRYRVYDIMPRVVYAPSRLDSTNREDAHAEMIPNHAFVTVIKTMGPQRQRYIPTTPLEIVSTRGGNDDDFSQNSITWHIPISVELLTSLVLPLPRGKDPETPPEAMAKATYEFQPKRRVATIPYGGSPQDPEVAQLRKTLYDAVVQDGTFRPKFKKDGRPQFFFLQNDAKACYTADGLGMAVYDWRPNFIRANEIGIELELQE